MTSRLLIGIVVFSFLAAPGLFSERDSQAAAYVFETQMFGTNQVPEVETVGWGFFRFYFNEDRSAANVTVDIKGLAGGNVISADIHLGAPGINGPVVKHVADGGYIVTSARVSFSREELAEMASGAWYISLKTQNHPDGEMRGQIMPPADFLPSPVPAPPLPAQPSEQPSSRPSGGPFTIRPPSTGNAGLAD